MSTLMPTPCLLSLTGNAPETPTTDLSIGQRLSEAQAGPISLTGILIVFIGLMVLCLFMIFLNRVFSWLDARATAKQAAREARETKPSTPNPPPAKPEPEPEWEYMPDPALVPVSTLAVAVLAAHLFEIGDLRLGEERTITVEDRPHTVVLQSVGYANRVSVDGEEVTFMRSQVAPNDAVGAQLVAITED